MDDDADASVLVLIAFVVIHSIVNLQNQPKFLCIAVIGKHWNRTSPMHSP